MRAYLLCLALLLAGPGAMAQSGDRVPSFAVERNCSSEASNGAAVAQAKAGCVSDEIAAKKRVEQEWSRLKPDLKRQCVGESEIGGDQSYVELLTCLQMSSDWSWNP